MISLERNSSNSLLGGGRFSRFIGRTLRVRNCKSLLLIALLVGAAGTLSAQEGYSAGVFSVSSTKQIHFATENLPGFYNWEQASTHDLLSEDEWHYLLQSRTNAYDLYALGRIQTAAEPAEYTNGLFILPDYETWIQPAGVATLDVNHTQDGYEKNTYTAAEWALMEAAGAVFFPAAGYSEDGTTPIDAGTHGSYWIGTELGANAYRLKIEANEVSELFNMPKTNYYSVRTVNTVEALNENDEQSVTNTIIAARRAAGDTWADIYRTLRKAGCFNTLTLPFNVPDIEDSPLAGAEVYTFSGATVEGGTLRLDITPVVSSALTAGTPYLIQWPNTGEVISLMHFEGITWDDDNTADDAGVGAVTFHGFYGKTHISDETHGADHLHLFLGGNNQLYWPTDGGDATAKMLGFRAWFQISAPAGSQIRRGMPAKLHVSGAFGSTTDLENVQKNDVQCTKELLNGQLIIIRNGEKYTLNGQKL